jgi:hypothetical protein
LLNNSRRNGTISKLWTSYLVEKSTTVSAKLLAIDVSENCPVNAIHVSCVDSGKVLIPAIPIRRPVNLIDTGSPLGGVVVGPGVSASDGAAVVGTSTGAAVEGVSLGTIVGATVVGAGVVGVSTGAGVTGDSVGSIVGAKVVGAGVTGAGVTGAKVVGAGVVGTSTGAGVTGANVGAGDTDGASVFIVGGTVDGASVTGASVVGADVMGAFVSGSDVGTSVAGDEVGEAVSSGATVTLKIIPNSQWLPKSHANVMFLPTSASVKVYIAGLVSPTKIRPSMSQSPDGWMYTV